MRRGPTDRERRTLAAEDRAEARANRTAQQQLDKLNALLGEGEGAVKERKRLEKQLRDK
tara:strand:+ start:2036 stop:2212 length:177 start_codon:yes stop_codon:yes gene_type:complete